MMVSNQSAVPLLGLLIVYMRFLCHEYLHNIPPFSILGKNVNIAARNGPRGELVQSSKVTLTG